MLLGAVLAMELLLLMLLLVLVLEWIAVIDPCSSAIEVLAVVTAALVLCVTSSAEAAAVLVRETGLRAKLCCWALLMRPRPEEAFGVVDRLSTPSLADPLTLLPLRLRLRLMLRAAAPDPCAIARTGEVVPVVLVTLALLQLLVSASNFEAVPPRPTRLGPRDSDRDLFGVVVRRIAAGKRKKRKEKKRKKEGMRRSRYISKGKGEPK